MASSQLTEPAKLLLLASILQKGNVITKNGKAFLKELILKRDTRLMKFLVAFDADGGQNPKHLDLINRLIEEEAEKLYDTLFDGCSLEHGKTVSKAERQVKGLSSEKSLIYGEVEFHSFAKVLRKISPKPGSVFYDLGSGTGKAVFVARFLHDFGQCKGIELLEGLSKAADDVQAKYDQGEYRQYLSVTSPGDVTLVQGSILTADWSDGDVVFANSTCFDDDLMDDMGKKGEALKPGTYFVTFTKGLSSPHFEVMERKRYKMSWGPATVYIHRRLNHDGTAVDSETLKDVPDDDSYDDESDSEEDEDEDDDDDDDDDDDSDSEEEALEDLD